MSVGTILIYSGGLDSTVLLHWLKARNYEVTAIHFHYGSKHTQAESQCAIYNCNKLRVPLIHINIKDIFTLSGSTLLQGREVIPEGHYEEESMKSTVVPFRNGILLSIAASVAETRNCKFLAYGAHKGDHAIYPDCRQQFIDNMYNAIRFGTYNNIELIAPFERFDKGEIVRHGIIHDVEFEHTHTCYNGINPPCGKCGACVERAEAFECMNITDPLIKEV